MRFKKVYVEITNCCNFHCSFCYHSHRPATTVSPEVFSAILSRLRPFTKYLYLHVLGEPLLHPQLPRLISMAVDMGFEVNITTNGSLLSSRSDLPELNLVRQFNVSLHDGAENVVEECQKDYFLSAFEFAHKHAEHSYISFRLWNQGADDVNEYNIRCLNSLQQYFKVTLPVDVLQKRNTKIADHIFLQNAARFSWPGEADNLAEEHTCYALRDHIAVLSDGTVVPCCLDADGQLALGNLLTDDLTKMLSSEKAKLLLNGFRNHRAVMPICQHCGFKVG